MMKICFNFSVILHIGIKAAGRLSRWRLLRLCPVFKHNRSRFGQVIFWLTRLKVCT